MLVTKRDGRKELLDITKIQKMTSDATKDLEGVSQSDLELDAKIKFIDGMHSSDIQDALIKTAVEKIDIDVPNWTFVAARLRLYDLYHEVGKVLGNIKGNSYGPLQTTIDYGIAQNRYKKDLCNGFDVEDLSNYIKPERDLQFTYLGIKTAIDKYLTKDVLGQTFELPQHLFMMIAMFLASKEKPKNKQQKAKDFYDVISTFEVMIATPTLSGARKIRSQLSSCFIGSAPDNIEGIFDSYKEMSLLSKFGGGIGWDWNEVRCRSSVIDNNVNAAGGTTPWLKITNDIAIAVDQLGTRKGAIAVYLEPWHIDIKEFLDLKKNSGEERLRAHDIFPALWINDLFMERVKADAEWTLFDPYQTPELSELHGEAFKTQYMIRENDPKVNRISIKAKDLWKQVLTNYFESGSPFLCFKDTANRANPNSHVGHIRSSNLCTEIFQNTSPNVYSIKAWISEDEYFIIKEGELALTKNEFLDDPYIFGKQLTVGDIVRGIVVGVNEEDKSFQIELLSEEYQKPIYALEKECHEGETAVCNLASINLSRVNTKEDIERVTKIAMNMLDNVVDLNFYPTKKAKDTNLKSRAVGLGVMGEAEMLASKGIMFGSQEHFEFIDSIMEMVSFNAIKGSAEIAVEKGSYPNFNGSAWSEGILPIDRANTKAVELTKNNSRVYSEEEYNKLRESVRNGMRNGYLMAIAPTSSISILVGTTQAIEPIYKKKFFEENMSGLIPVVAPKLSPETWNYYPSAFDIEQMDLIKAASVRQKWIDQGQSTNVFMRLDKASGKYLNDIYMLAWEYGLKSTYYLRSQSPEAKSDVADRSMECSGCQ